jgi:hypothetical protein
LPQVESSLVLASLALAERHSKQPATKKLSPHAAKNSSRGKSRPINNLRRNLPTQIASGTVFAFPYLRNASSSASNLLLRK